VRRHTGPPQRMNAITEDCHVQDQLEHIEHDRPVQPGEEQ